MNKNSKIYYRKRQQLKFKFFLSVFFCITLMFVDSKYPVLQPIRSLVATVLYPIELSLRQPIILSKKLYETLSSQKNIRNEREMALKALNLKAFDASREQWLLAENQRLRKLLNIKEQLMVQTIAAEVVRDSFNPFSQIIQIDRGTFHGVGNGDVVIDDNGVIGQVTRAHPISSEVRLILDQEQILPVQNLRTGQHGLVYGMAQDSATFSVELRYITQNSDIKVNDLLVTNSTNDVYIAGIPVAIVKQIEKTPNTPFLKIIAKPLGKFESLYHILVVKPDNNSANQTDSESNIDNNYSDDYKEETPNSNQSDWNTNHGEDIHQ